VTKAVSAVKRDERYSCEEYLGARRSMVIPHRAPPDIKGGAPGWFPAARQPRYHARRTRRTLMTLGFRARTRMSVETMKEMSMKYENQEYAGVTHGPIIEAAMPDIFEFFKKHTKAGREKTCAV
jgi:hypothetical protein